MAIGCFCRYRLLQGSINKLILLCLKLSLQLKHINLTTNRLVLIICKYSQCRFANLILISFINLNVWANEFWTLGESLRLILVNTIWLACQYHFQILIWTNLFLVKLKVTWSVEWVNTSTLRSHERLVLWLVSRWSQLKLIIKKLLLLKLCCSYKINILLRVLDRV